VAAALDGVDVVRERVDRFVVALVVLDRDLDRDRHLLAALMHRALARDEDRRPVQRRAVAVQVLDERDDAALVAELVLLPLRSSLMLMRSPAFRNDSSRRRWESTSNSNSVLAKIVRVGQERDARAGLVGGADLLRAARPGSPRR
jgi:hypothetical protein